MVENEKCNTFSCNTLKCCTKKCCTFFHPEIQPTKKSDPDKFVKMTADVIPVLTFCGVHKACLRTFRSSPKGVPLPSWHYYRQTKNARKLTPEVVETESVSPAVEWTLHQNNPPGDLMSGAGCNTPR